MKERGIVITGSGSLTQEQKKELQNKIGSDVILVTPEQAKEVIGDGGKLLDSIPHYGNEPKNKFICKGKHQYEIKNGQWICQCGRNIND